MNTYPVCDTTEEKRLAALLAQRGIAVTYKKHLRTAVVCGKWDKVIYIDPDKRLTHQAVMTLLALVEDGYFN